MKQSLQSKAILRLANDSSLECRGDNFKSFSRKQLINSINRIHFADGVFSLRFRHNKYQSITSLPAKPQACQDNHLHCLWATPLNKLTKLRFHTFEYFSFTDGLKQIQVPAKIIAMNETGVDFELPDQSFETIHREVKRFETSGISAQITQDGWLIDGELISFSTQALAISFHHKSSLLKNEIDPQNPVQLVLKKNNEFIFSGSCSILRQKNTQDKKMLVLKPLTERVQRMKSKNNRCERLILSPLPTIAFMHPVIDKKFHLGLQDISGQGFLVEESPHNSTLLPGMVIPDLEIQFMHGFSIRCKSQVLYCTHNDEVIKSGFVILDMSMDDHLKFSSLLHQAKNKHSYLSTSNIELDALWDFFFDSGFIYPEKYKHISEQKEEFISTFNELYNEHPGIVRHLTYQDKGKIYGHISIHRYYQKTWMMHHLAAIKSPKHKAGLVVLENVLKLINELHSLPSAKMEYLIGYFRPNNRFSSRLFGPRTVRTINDLNKCSVDEFAYFYLDTENKQTLPEEAWVLSESDTVDLNILKHWYGDVSGGLTIRALDLDPESFVRESVTNEEYSAAGFKRNRKLFSLKKNDELIAVLIVNISDFGINMSDLTNCIQVFILDKKYLRKNVLLYALNKLAEYYQNRRVPVLLYPKEYADLKKIPYDKTYMLGILNLEFIGDYLDFENSLTTSNKTVVIRQA